MGACAGSSSLPTATASCAATPSAPCGAASPSAGGGEKSSAAIPFTPEALFRCAFPPPVCGCATTPFSTTAKDQAAAEKCGANLLYGELTPAGVAKMLDSQHLNAANGSRLCDLGRGQGHVLVQAFFEYPNLVHVVGIELAHSRWKLACRALQNLADAFPRKFRIVKETRPGTGPGAKPPYVQLITVPDATAEAAHDRVSRTLEFRNGDLFLCEDAIFGFDVVIMQTCFPDELNSRLSEFLVKMRAGVRVVTFSDVVSLLHINPSDDDDDNNKNNNNNNDGTEGGGDASADTKSSVGGGGGGGDRARAVRFEQLESNCDFDDKFPTSWNNAGVHFYCWRVVPAKRLESATAAATASSPLAAHQDNSTHIL
eukprot:gnl/Spiro4/3297_TR1607_c0_g2_i1.p1 gnl/Spiro4/3297_TR1607_c0_g2~~gnl/Spiro4/3297_TR1607_c0_g2_i1.p1  ORF type:complete len:409 (+),score=132.04 gnl/Spiro4/3297_TR1607_c0_g2_i1:119-1228(+)